MNPVCTAGMDGEGGGKSGAVGHPRALVFLLGLAMGLGFGFYALGHLPGQCTDVDGFGALGMQFAREWGFGGSVRRGPLYPLFLGLLYRAFGPGNHAAVVAAQAVVLGLLCLSVRSFSLLLFRSRRLAFWTGVCAAIHPMLWWYVPRLWVELPYALLTLWAVHMGVRALERPDALRLAAFGAATALACLCKATSVLHPLFLGAGILAGWLLKARPCAHLGFGDVVHLAAVPTLAMCVVLAPWTYRNWRVAGRFIPVSGHLPVEFFRGTAFADQNSFLLRKGIAGLWTEAMAREEALMERETGGAGGKVAGMEKDDLFAKPMREMIFREPLRFALKTAKQIPAFWTLGETRTKSLFFLGNALVLLGLGGIGLWRKREGAGALVVFWTVVYFNLCYAAILAYARYSMMLYPLLLPYVAWEGAGLWRGIAERRKPPEGERRAG